MEVPITIQSFVKSQSGNVLEMRRRIPNRLAVKRLEEMGFVVIEPKQPMFIGSQHTMPENYSNE